MNKDSINDKNIKGDDNMSNYQEFLKQNKDKLIHIAKTTNKYNEKGQCLISKTDEDFDHDSYGEQ